MTLTQCLRDCVLKGLSNSGQGWISLNTECSGKVKLFALVILIMYSDVSVWHHWEYGWNDLACIHLHQDILEISPHPSLCLPLLSLISFCYPVFICLLTSLYGIFNQNCDVWHINKCNKWQPVTPWSNDLSHCSDCYKGLLMCFCLCQ